MANSWLRLWHDMPNDPKWRTISRASKQPISLVKAVYLHLLVDASQNKERGLFSISAEDLSSALDVEGADICAILESMQSRVLDGQRLSGWQERQPALETSGDGSNSKGYGSNYVYYVVCRSTGLVKIGVSRNPWSRLKDLQTAAGSKYELLATIKTDMRSEVEVHKLFAASRVRGEWFKYTEALSLVVEALKSKEIEDYAGMLALIAELPSEMFTTTVVATVETPTTTVATKDTDKDTDKDKDKDTDKEDMDICTNVHRLASKTPYQQLVDLYHTKCNYLPRVTVVNDSRKRAMKARFSEVMNTEKWTEEKTIQWFGEYYEIVNQSKFLTGRTAASNGHRPFKADWDWIHNPNNFVKVVEGKYNGG